MASLFMCHLVPQFYEMSRDIRYFRFTLEGQFNWELGQPLILANFTHAEELALNEAIFTAVCSTNSVIIIAR